MAARWRTFAPRSCAIVGVRRTENARRDGAVGLARCPPALVLRPGGAPAQAIDSTLRSPPGPPQERIRRVSTISVHTLDGGLRVVIERMGAVRSAGVCWLVPGGTGHDEPGLDGRAAVTSEMLLRGAAGLSSREQADAFDRLGAGRSAEPGTRFMRLGASLLGARLPEVLPLLSSMILSPNLDAQGLEPAKELALQAIDSLADDPHRRAVLAARARHLPDPYGRSGLGTPEGIGALTREAVAGGWQRDARPGGSILAIAGDVDEAATLDALGAAMAGWAGDSPELGVAPTPARGYAHEPDDSAQVHVILVHDAPAEPDPASVLERVVIGVLSGGMSARLFTEVREKRGLCYAVHAGYRAERDFGLVSAEVGTTPERAQESLDVLHAELLRIHETGITPEEFERTIVRIKSGLVFSGESSGARAGALASDVHKLGRPRSLAEMAAEVDAVTLDRVNDYLKGRRLGRITIQTVGPAELRPPAGV